MPTTEEVRTGLRETLARIVGMGPTWEISALAILCDEQLAALICAAKAEAIRDAVEGMSEHDIKALMVGDAAFNLNVPAYRAQLLAALEEKP